MEEVGLAWSENVRMEVETAGENEASVKETG